MFFFNFDDLYKFIFIPERFLYYLNVYVLIFDDPYVLQSVYFISKEFQSVFISSSLIAYFYKIHILEINVMMQFMQMIF